MDKQIDTNSLFNVLTSTITETYDDYKISEPVYNKDKDTCTIMLTKNKSYDDVHLEINKQYINIINKRKEDVKWCETQMRLIIQKINNAMLNNADEKTLKTLHNEYKKYLFIQNNHNKEITKIKTGKGAISAVCNKGYSIKLDISIKQTRVMNKLSLD